MDSYTEYLVRHKHTPRTKIIKLLVVLLAIVVSAVVIFMIPSMGHWATLTFLIFGGIVFGTWKLLQQFSCEFEYTLVGSNLDVDKIIGRRRRKNVTSLELKSIEKISAADQDQMSSYQRAGNVIDASSGCTEDTFVIQYRDTSKGMVMLLLLSPNEAILRMISKYSKLSF